MARRVNWADRCDDVRASIEWHAAPPWEIQNVSEFFGCCRQPFFEAIVERRQAPETRLHRVRPSSDFPRCYAKFGKRWNVAVVTAHLYVLPKKLLLRDLCPGFVRK